MTGDTYKILAMRAENFKRISVVQITPEGALIQVTGANGEGKSSVLDAIWATLEGLAAAPSHPVRRGKDKARIVLTLGTTEPKFIVERKFTATGSTVTISTPDGAKYGSPQKLMGQMYGALSFDPAGFMREPPAKQYDILRRIVKPAVDIDAIDKRRKEIYEARTETNAKAKAAAARAAGITVQEGLPETAPDRAGILKRLMDVDNFNAVVRAKEAQRIALAERVENAVEIHRRRVEALEAMERRHAIERANFVQERDGAAALFAEAADAVEKNKAVVIEPLQDPAAIRAELDAAETTIAAIADRDRKKAHEDEAARWKTLAAEETASIDALDLEKSQAIGATPMPIPGLSFRDGVVLFNDLPLEQASDAERLRISAAIGAALNPKLRVMLVREGSLLDSKSLALLAEFAEANNFQIWCERVDESGAVGVVMEDGHVKGQEELVLAFEKEGKDGKGDDVPGRDAAGNNGRTAVEGEREAGGEAGTPSAG